MTKKIDNEIKIVGSIIFLIVFLIVAFNVSYVTAPTALICGFVGGVAYKMLYDFIP